MRTWNNQGTDVTGLRPMAIAVKPAPPPVLPIGLAAAALIAVGVAIAVIVSAGVRRWILVFLGNRLILASSECTYQATIEERGGELRARLRKSDETDYSLSIANPPRVGDLELWATSVRPIIEQGSTVLVELESPGLFLRPWAQHLTGELANLANVPVAGQIVPISAKASARGAPTKRVVFAALGCEDARNYPERIDGVTGHLTQLSTLLRHRFVRVREKKTLATVGDLIDALASADIVHVLAHASPERIFLNDGDLTAQTIRDSFLDRQLRCRLLVLSACEASRLEGPKESFVAALVERGVTVLGATKKIDAVVAEHFFPEFYRGMVPRSSSDGATLAESMRRGGRVVSELPGEGVWRADLASLILYGNPTLKLRFSTGKNL